MRRGRKGAVSVTTPYSHRPSWHFPPSASVSAVAAARWGAPHDPPDEMEDLLVAAARSGSPVCRRWPLALMM